MAADLEGLAREFNPQEAKPAVLQSLEAIVTAQVDRLIELGFHAEVYPDLPNEEAKAKYRADFAIPQGGITQPEAYKGRFDVLLVIDPRVLLTRQYALSRPEIIEYIDAGKITDETPVPGKPYAIWTHDAQRYRPYSVDKAKEQFADDEVGGLQVEVTSLYLHHPEFFRDHGVDAAGSHYGSGGVPYLDTFFGRPRVSADSSAGRDRHWGALSRGKEIIDLGA